MFRAFRILALIAPFVFSASAGVIILPGANALAEGTANTAVPTLGLIPTQQWAFSASALAGLRAGTQFSAIGFRADSAQLNLPAADLAFSYWNLQLSQSANAVGSLSSDVAGNIGTDAVTVHSGPLTIPAAAFSVGSAPNPFFFIPFQRPYTYMGGDLLFTLELSAGADFRLDAIPVGGVADSVGYAGGSGTWTHFFAVPVTALQYNDATVPEPSTLMATAAGALALIALHRKR